MQFLDTHINLKNLLLINKKLPIPNQKIITNFRNLPYTVALGCRAEVDIEYSKTSTDFFLINDTKIFCGMDATINFINRDWKATTQKFLDDGPEIHIGDGITPIKYPNHISTPWTPLIWRIEYPERSVPLSERKGWCCTMGNKKYQNDRICDLLANNHMDNIVEQWFCYDGGSEYESLIPFMFRKPNPLAKEYVAQNINEMLVANFHDPTLSYGKVMCQGPWHNQSLIELVPETFLDFFGPTEKIFKPIAAGMPFVLVGSLGSLRKLKQMGFKSFTPYIDESYDMEPVTDKRIDMAVSAMFDFIKNPQNLQSIQDICDHNRRTFAKIISHDVDFQIAKKLRHLITF